MGQEHEEPSTSDSASAPAAEPTPDETTHPESRGRDARDAADERGEPEAQDVSGASGDEGAGGVEEAPPEAPVSPRVVEDEDMEPGVVPELGGRSRLRRLSGAFSPSGMWNSVGGGVQTLRKFSLPLLILIILATLSTLFHKILTPFILALILVYVMEPIVGRIERRRLPRWAAVISVYITFIGVVAASLVLFLPRLSDEMVSFAQTVPEEVQTLRKEQLPKLNERVQKLAGGLNLPSMPGAKTDRKKEPDFSRVKRQLHTARRHAAARAVAMAEVQRRVGLAAQVRQVKERDQAATPGEVVFSERWTAAQNPDVMLELRRGVISASGGSWSFGGNQPALRMVPGKSGSMMVYLNDVDVRVEPASNGAWRVVREHGSNELAPRKARDGHDSMFDLEHTIDKMVDDLAKSSGRGLTNAIGVVQKFAVGVVQAFVMLVLTLMVAAFISIDLPALMAFVRRLVPREHHEQYNVLLAELDRGLGGVVRGQLMICLVNGTFTYIGMLLLGIKFSFLLGVVAGCMSIIPIFGTVLSTVPIVLFGLTDGFMTGILALLWILGIHFVEANFLNPKIIGTSAHIHPVIVIFALLAGESTFGLMGALLAVPTTSILLTLFKFFFMTEEHLGEAEAGESS